jgi:hypothetical protein
VVAFLLFSFSLVDWRSGCVGLPADLRACDDPGLPLGFALFGPNHAGGWIAGAILGYGLTALAIWVPIAA